ncbi:BPSL0067 family protein [Pseudoduganella sp.]|uniref:BPSL0067 family protein n=1 Tax=Pseudoduganella sp. TaxID=1880898 RepID=UPI0035AFADC5
MQYIYSQVADLEGKAKVGSTQCVALVQAYAGAPHHRSWKAGAPVLGNNNIRIGTAIATFVNGGYQSKSGGNHAALFLRHGVNGFWVMDQWRDDRPPGENKKPTISSRFITARRLKQKKDGSWPDASNNADAYQIIE